jgi:hypothetical protein
LEVVLKRKGTKKLVAVLATMAMMMLTAGIARADNLTADGDTVSSDGGNGTNLAVEGSECLTDYVSVGRAELTYNGSTHFASGSVVTATSTVDAAGVAAGVAASGGTHTMPSPWDKDSVDQGPAISVTVPKTTLDGTYGVTVVVSGTNTSGASYSDSDGYNVHVRCGPAISISGVTNGATYTAGSVPTVTCTVTDPKLATAPTVAPTFSTTSGTQTATCSYTNALGVTVSVSRTYTVTPVTTSADTTAPTVSCGEADDDWHAEDQSVTCTATDAGGLADPAQASFTLSTSVLAGNDTTNASTNDVQVCDTAANCVTAGPVSGFKIDKKAPTTSVTGGGAGPYVIGAEPTLACDSDDGSGSGDGDEATGSFTTGSGAGIGSHTFTCSGATDAVGNEADDATQSYSVIYGICGGGSAHTAGQPINSNGSSVFKLGSTVPVKIKMCDALGNVIEGSAPTSPRMVSSKKNSGETINEDSIVSTTPDSAFRWTGDHWIYNLNTKNLVTGTLYSYSFSLNDGSSVAFAFTTKK